MSSTAGGGQVSALSRELRNGPDTEHRLHSPSCRWSIHVTVKAHGQDNRGELRTPKPALPLSLTAAVCVLSVKSLAYKFKKCKIRTKIIGPLCKYYTSS